MKKLSGKELIRELHELFYFGAIENSGDEQSEFTLIFDTPIKPKRK